MSAVILLPADEGRRKQRKMKFCGILCFRFLGRTCSKTTSLMLLSLSSMLLVVSFVTRFPILYNFSLKLL